MASSIQAREPKAGASEGRLHVKWFSAQGFFLHFVVLFVVIGCTIATWWQLSRALSGNGLSWAYTFEWPCFAVYAIVLWWKVLHERAAEEAAAAHPTVVAPTFDDSGELTVSGRRLIDQAAGEEISRALQQGGWHP